MWATTKYEIKAKQKIIIKSIHLTVFISIFVVAALIYHPLSLHLFLLVLFPLIYSLEHSNNNIAKCVYLFLYVWQLNLISVIHLILYKDYYQRCYFFHFIPEEKWERKSWNKKKNGVNMHAISFQCVNINAHITNYCCCL